MQEIIYASELLFLRVVLIKDEPTMFVLIKKLSKIKDNIVFKRTPQGRETHSNVYIQMKGRDARIIS